MEQVLGHVSHYQTLRAVVDREVGIDPHWVEVTYAGSGRLEGIPGLPKGISGTLRGFLQVREGLRHRAVDALLFHTQKPAVFQWDLMARIPSVLSLDVTPRQYDELGVFYEHVPDGSGPVARTKHWINCRTFGLAHRIVVWSTWVKESLIKDYGVPAERVDVIPPGVDLTLWKQPAQRSNEIPRILFVGGDFERKGGTLLLEWYRDQGRGRCELDIVTRSQVAPESGIQVHRNVSGNTPEARRLFAQADVFVLPSLGECFGIASVEAMAAGLPVVATNVGGAADIVDHGQTGFLIRPNDRTDLANALDALLTDTPTRQAMGLRGRARAERMFDGVANAQALITCLREIAA
jgi:glycosyltransferase involved in cell wall biosynthesis